MNFNDIVVTPVSISLQAPRKAGSPPHPSRVAELEDFCYSFSWGGRVTFASVLFFCFSTLIALPSLPEGQTCETEFLCVAPEPNFI